MINERSKEKNDRNISMENEREEIEDRSDSVEDRRN
jgi:hypothetical protein